MKKNLILEGKSIILRPIKKSDCNLKYLKWLQDKEINKYLETRWSKQSIKGIKKYVEEMNKSKNDFLFAIQDIKTSEHIGNIKLGNLDFNHMSGETSYFIGNKNFWKKGKAFEAINLIMVFFFDVLKLEYLLAGVYETNTSSKKLLKKLGFIQQGRFKKKITSNGKRIDHLFFGLNKNQYEQKKINV